MDITIKLEIGLSPTLEGFLTKLVGGSPVTPKPADQRREAQATHQAAVEPETVEVVKEAASPQVEIPAKGRGRPRKDAPSATPATGDPDLLGLGSDTGQTATTAASPSEELEASMLAETSEEVGRSKEDVMAAMQAFQAKHSDALRLRGLLEKHGGGAKSLMQIPAEHYGAVYDGITAELG